MTSPFRNAVASYNIQDHLMYSDVYRLGKNSCFRKDWNKSSPDGYSESPVAKSPGGTQMKWHDAFD